MPMDFPDLKSLKFTARIHDFRDIGNGESEDHYREVLADHVAPRDFIESQEIRNKVGWDQWSDEQNRDMLKRAGGKNDPTKG